MFLAFALPLFAACIVGAQDRAGEPERILLDQNLPALVPAITRPEIEAHLHYLASDAMLGRETGSKQAVEAARYLAAVLQHYGVEPAGDGKSFLQRVPFAKAEVLGTPLLELTLRSGTAPACVWQKDWRYPAVGFEKRSLRILRARGPAELPKTGLESTALFLDEPTWRAQREWLAGAGHAEGKGLGLVLVPAGTDRLSRRRPMLAVEGELLAALRADAIESLTLEVRVPELLTYNVVGILRGEGPGAEQAIVLSAHYDHLGGDEHAPPEGPDKIMNGADDDASGCAVVLELAGALAQARPLAHSVVFLLATGEEIGLVGTNHYLEQPCVPLANTLANLNFEMLGRPDELVGGAGKLWLTGWDETNLGRAFVQAGIPVAVDPRPDQHFYERSDNFAFVRKGIVGQTLSTYNLHTDYHKVTDEVDKIDFEHLTQCARTSLDAARALADGRIVPAWAPKPAKPAAPKPGESGRDGKR